MKEVGFALLEQDVGALLDREHVGVLLPVVVGTEKPSERDVIDLRETERVAAILRRVGRVPACRLKSLEVPPATPFHGETRRVAIRLEQGLPLVRCADRDRPLGGAVRCVPAVAAHDLGKPGRVGGLGAAKQQADASGWRGLRRVQDFADRVPGVAGIVPGFRVPARRRDVVRRALRGGRRWGTRQRWIPRRRIGRGLSLRSEYLDLAEPRVRAARCADGEREREYGADAEHDLDRTTIGRQGADGYRMAVVRY